MAEHIVVVVGSNESLPEFRLERPEFEQRDRREDSEVGDITTSIIERDGPWRTPEVVSAAQRATVVR